MAVCRSYLLGKLITRSHSVHIQDASPERLDPQRLEASFLLDLSLLDQVWDHTHWGLPVPS